MGAVRSLVEAAEDVGQGLIDVVSDAGSAIDDAVRENIPGGWAIPVAVATAGALAPEALGTAAAGEAAGAGLAEGAFPGLVEGTVASDAGIAALTPSLAAPPVTGLGSGVADLGLPTGTEMVTQGGLAPAPTVGQGAALAAPTTTPTGFTVGAPAGLTAMEAGLEGLQQGAKTGAIAGGIKSAVTGQDPLEGALHGAGIGALTGGIGGVAGNVAADLGAGEAGTAAARGAAMGATGAALTGGDPLTGLLAGGVGGGIANLTQGALADSGLDKTVVGPVAQTAGQLAAGVATGNTGGLENILLSGGLSAGTGYVTSQIPGFSEMSDAAKSAANGAIKSLITTGTINEAALINAGIQAANASTQSEPVPKPIPETAWATQEDFETALAAAQTEANDTAKLFGFKDAAERQAAAEGGFPNAMAYYKAQELGANTYDDFRAALRGAAQQETPAVVQPTTQVAQESAAGLDQLVNAFTNPESTASYPGTNVADISGGITGLPTDQPTEQDYEQLGVGLPTGIESILLPLIAPAPEPAPEPTYTEAPIGYQEQPAGIESLLPQAEEPAPKITPAPEPVAVEDGTTKGIEDLIAQMTPPSFEGIDMTGGQTDTYQASNVEEPNVPTLPDTTPIEPKVTPEIPQVADDYTTAGIQDIINQLPGGTGMDNLDFSGISDIDLTGGQDATYQASNTEEPNVVTVTPDGGVDANGNPTYVDIAGNPVNADGTPISAAPTQVIGGNSMLDKIAAATGLSPTTLKWLGAGLGATGLASLLGQQQKAPAPTPYTGPLRNIQYNPATYTPYTYKPYAAGGIATGGIANLGGYSDGGRLLRGPGDGVSDSIPAVIGNKQPARLADGEFVIPARIVSEIGNGSTDAGARKLYEMMDRVQAARRKTTGKGKFAANTKADKYLPT